MSGMTYFDAIQSARGERRDPVARARRTGMREHRESTGTMNHPDRLEQRQTLLRNVSGAPAAEISIERVSEVYGPAAVHECACHVRTTHRSTSGLREHV